MRVSVSLVDEASSGSWKKVTDIYETMKSSPVSNYHKTTKKMCVHPMIFNIYCHNDQKIVCLP